MVKFLKVGANQYPVRQRPLGMTEGYCVTHPPKHREIVVSSRSEPREKVLTLFHEAVHAVIAEYGLAAALGEDGTVEELLARTIEVGVANLFLENKNFAREFVTRLMEKPDGE